MVDLQIERATEARAQIVVKCRDREHGVEAIEKIIDIERARRAGKHAQAEGAHQTRSSHSPNEPGANPRHAVGPVRAPDLIRCRDPKRPTESSYDETFRRCFHRVESCDRYCR